MNNLASTIALTLTLTLGVGIGSLVTYRLEAKVDASCPIPSASSQVGNPGEFFARTPLPTTGGHQY